MKTIKRPILTQEHPHIGEDASTGVGTDSPSQPPTKSINIIIILKYIQKYILKKLKENGLGIEHVLMNMHRVHRYVDDFIEMLILENSKVLKARAPEIEKKSWMKIAIERGYILAEGVNDTNFPFIEIGGEKHKFVEIIRENPFRKKMLFEDFKKSLVYFGTDFAGIEHLVSIDLTKDIKPTKSNPVAVIRDSFLEYPSKIEYIPILYFDSGKDIYRIDLGDVTNIHDYRVLMIR